MSKIQKNVVFIDNDINNWTNDMDFYDKTVDYIRVPNTGTPKSTSSSNTGTPKSTSSSNTEPRYTNSLAKKGNRYATEIRKYSSRNFVNRGIDNKIANRLKKWSSIQTNKQKYALFDWDGTISVTEGFSIEAIKISRPMPFILSTSSLRKLSSATLTESSNSSRFAERSKGVLRTSPMMDFLLPTFRGGKTKTHNKKRKTRKMFAAKYQNPTLQEIVESQEYQTVHKQPLIFSLRRPNGSSPENPLTPTASRPELFVLPSKEFLNDMFVYLMRPDRVEMLRDLFRTLLENGVQVHIFTHNPYASTTNPYRKIFIEMMSRLFDSRENLDCMLHSTIDYTKPGEPSLKSNILRGLDLDLDLDTAK